MEASSFGRPVKVRKLTPARAGMLLDGSILEGTVHVEPHHARFSDAWEDVLDGGRRFVPVTAAELRRGPEAAPERADFILVDKDLVKAAYPLDDTSEVSPYHVPLHQVDVALHLDGLRIEGAAHLRPGAERLSDAWGSVIGDHRPFIPISHPLITDTFLEHRMASPDVVAVSKADVVAMYPVAEERRERTAIRRADLVAISCALVFEHLRVEGTMHFDTDASERARFSDLWEGLMRDGRPFAVVSDATIGTPDGQRVMAAADVMVVDKREVLTAMPLD